MFGGRDHYSNLNDMTTQGTSESIKEIDPEVAYDRGEAA